MNYWIILGIIVFLILTIMLIIPMFVPHEIENRNIGNVVMDYISTRCANDNLVMYTSKDSEMNEFLSLLPSDVTIPEVCRGKRNYSYTISNFYTNTGWALEGRLWFFEGDSSKKMEFWKNIAPTLRGCLDEAFQKMDIDRTKHDVVIHMRCSDNPFQDHKNFTISSRYHIQTMEYYDWAFNKLNITTDEKITILGTHKWRGNKENEETCTRWTHGLKENLESRGYQVAIQQKSITQDYATSFYAKKSIGSCSSYSFTSIIGKEHFIMPLLGTEKPLNKKYIYPNEIPDWMYPRPGILHHTVKNYHTYTNEHLAKSEKSFINQ